jgi:hypothetical protein
MRNEPELKASTPHPLHPEGFNSKAELPYGSQVEHIRSAMMDFLDFLGFINQQLRSRDIQRIETILMPANFSSIVGEFMAVSIPRYCTTLVKNRYHNGHPDLIPAGMFENNAVQYTHEGIEIKASRYLRAWQGHNPENIWLMVFVFDSNRPADASKNVPPKPFRFVEVVGARLTKRDWIFAGRSETSRRTITASVTESGYRKMMGNWIYKDLDLLQLE